MGYDKNYLVKVFAERTRKNLKVIDDLKNTHNAKRAEVFEITQLLNSCLGLLVFPRQVCFKNIPETPLDELASEGWPIPHDEGGFTPASNLNKLIGHLRNGITHGHLKFFPDDKGEIESLLVWD